MANPLSAIGLSGIVFGIIVIFAGILFGLAVIGNIPIYGVSEIGTLFTLLFLSIGIALFTLGRTVFRKREPKNQKRFSLFIMGLEILFIAILILFFMSATV